MGLTIAFDNSYARLPGHFFARQAPQPVRAPKLIATNAALARALGIDPQALAGPEGLAMVAGNQLPAGAEPLAQAYAGHQFGGFSPQLGDGRALLLGEVVAPSGTDLAGRRFDLQLKGSGPTPFSRRGDGRAWLGPVLREYLLSEAMTALGVPSTRALAAVETGETILRDGLARPGAVLLRVAASHIRIGTFQFFAARGDDAAVAVLCDHVLARHYPGAEGALGLLRAVIEAQAKLVAQWMALGFVHGVMNTDNMAISGETIDYGPCAFLDAYHPQTVFSAIDAQGRYAYAQQPQIALWNLAQLAGALLSQLPQPQEAGIEAAQEALAAFAPCYQAAWLARFGAKIGLDTPDEADRALIEDLLSRMAVERADFTRVFRALAEAGPDMGPNAGPNADHNTGAETHPARAEFLDPAAFDGWALRWRARLAEGGITQGAAKARMQGANPAIIARNHRVEQAIAAAVEGDYAPFHRLNAALAQPFDVPADSDLRAAPWPDERVLRTFCGT